MRPLEEKMMVPGKMPDPVEGTLSHSEGCTTNWVPGRVRSGDVIVPRPGEEVAAFFYDESFDQNLVYTYSYQPESNWARYRASLSRVEWSSDPYSCPQDGYLRISVKTADDGKMPLETRHVVDFVSVIRGSRTASEPADCFREEVERVVRRVDEAREQGDLVLLLASDVHWSAGCPWDDTVRNMRKVAASISPDALVQLGDLTDGLAPSCVTSEIVSDLLEDLSSVGVPVHSCVGNHDTNYFRDNQDRMEGTDRYLQYLGRREPWYRVDFPHAGVRAIFLDSFEPGRRERYGFSLPELAWCAKELASSPKGWGVLVFSHVPLAAEMHVWSRRIRLGKPMRRLLQAFDRASGGALLAYVHGHNHADQTSNTYGFPIVSVGCAKLEDFEENKPRGSVTPHRVLGETSQELWDVMVVSARSRTVRFVRFGAGEDREVSHGRA